MTAEMRTRGMNWNLIWYASMRPRSNDRGNITKAKELDLESKCFNEAAI